MRIETGGATDVGRVRSNNEDCFRILTPLNLFVLSDGMGGEAHGEIASAQAVETVANHCLEAETNHAMPLCGEVPPGLTAKTARLVSAVHLANQKIHESAEADPERYGMGATLTAVWVDGQRLSVAHVGDSRAYLLRAGGLTQLTQDHSLVAEQVRRGMMTPQQAETSDMQSMLLRALGSQADVAVDAEEIALIERDIVVLCSDGLTRMVTDPEIASTLVVERDPQKAAERLIELANDNGGKDNVTVLVVRLEPKALSWIARLFGWGKGRNTQGHAIGSKGAGGN